MKISTIFSTSLALLGLCLVPLTTRAQHTTARLATSQTQLANNSTRVTVGTGDAISVEEFVIQGSQPKKIVVRGIGPSLVGVARYTAGSRPVDLR